MRTSDVSSSWLAGFDAVAAISLWFSVQRTFFSLLLGGSNC